MSAEDPQTLPSGAKIRFSPLTAKQANILAAGAEKSTTSTLLLASCTAEVIDHGPYTKADNANGFGWRRALVGDRLAALLFIRALTYGPSYEFKVRCSLCPVKLDLFRWEVQIPADITIIPYPVETLIAFREGARGVPVKLPDGRDAVAKIITGEDEEEAQEHARELAKEAEGKETTAMLARLFLSVDGMPSRPELFEDVPFPLIPEYVDAASAVFGGVETLIETACPRCGSEVPVQLPFGRGFFLPEKKSKRRSPG